MCRELTKTHEEVRRGPLGDLVGWAEDGVRGEVTIVVSGASPASVAADVDSLRGAVADLERAGEPRKDAIKTVAARAGVPKRVVYDAVHQIGQEDPHELSRHGAARSRTSTGGSATGTGRRCPSRCPTRSSTTTATSTSRTGRGWRPATRWRAPRRSAYAGSCRSAATCPGPSGPSTPRASTTSLVAGVALHPNEAPRLAAEGRLEEALAEIERLAQGAREGPGRR